MSRNNNIFIVRIDDRLIHGQVIVGWAKALNLNKIIVANNKLLNDKLKLQMMKIAVPSEISVEFLPIEEAIAAYKKNKWSDYASILLIESPEDAYKFVSAGSAGCKIEKINVGGLHINNQRKQITPNIALSDKDIHYLQKLLDLQIFLEGRAVPSDEEYKVEKLLIKKSK